MPLPHPRLRGRLSTSNDARGKVKLFRDAIQRPLASACEGSVASSAARPKFRTEQGPTFQAAKRFHRDPPRYHARGHVQQQAISAGPARTSPWRADLQRRWGHGARSSSWRSAAGTPGGENGHGWLSSRSGSGPNAQPLPTGASPACGCPPRANSACNLTRRPVCDGNGGAPAWAILENVGSTAPEAVRHLGCEFAFGKITTCAISTSQGTRLVGLLTAVTMWPEESAPP